MRSFFLFSLLVLLLSAGPSAGREKPSPPARKAGLLATYTIIADMAQSPVSHGGLKYERDNGAGNILLIKERVSSGDPLYRMIEKLPLPPGEKGKLLGKLSRGILKIAVDMGARPKYWRHNVELFEKSHASSLDFPGPPDLIIITHNHWTNYSGGLEYYQKHCPSVPVLITEDMKRGFLCFDFDQAGAPMFQTIRTVYAKYPLVMKTGYTPLTRHLAVITRQFRVAKPTIAVVNGQVSTSAYRDYPEYENTLVVRTKEGNALFTTCLHSLLYDAVNIAQTKTGKPVYLFCGGYEERHPAIKLAKQIAPDIEFWLCHCARVEVLQQLYKYPQWISRISMGESITIEE
ncbi:MAG: hypothetical protein RDV48_20730 [Candidatus Eremiobacteraeota bacterium]|nr:hypothetical protein [Candidatus Eremiobacteraeota bacterium]